MRTIKPQRLGVLHRTYEHMGRFWFVPTVMVAFEIDRPDVPLHEALLWRGVAEHFGVDEPFDEAMWKARGEVLVSGSAHPPKGPAPACQVRLIVGPEDAPLIDKRLYAVGDRVWERLGSSEPAPFSAMPVRWSHAFGGEGIADNPTGRGADRKQLPNIEDPQRLVRAPDDRPAPVSLSALDVQRPTRQRFAGTYDDAWLKNHYPGFPPDIDWRFFNVAPADQQLAAKLAGGERFVIENMHRERPRLEGRVPALVARAFITKVGDAERTLHEVGLEADTLHLFPGSLSGIVCYRGVVAIAEDDAADIAELLLAAEAPGAPKSLEHYAAVLRQRTEGELRGLYALADEDLLPPLPEGVDPMGHSGLGAKVSDDGMPPALAKLRGRVQAQLDAARQRQPQPPPGIDPVAMPELPEWEAPRDTAKLVRLVEDTQKRAREAQKDAEEKAKALEARRREEAAASGFDLDAMMEEAKRRAGGPPKFSAEAELARLRELDVLSRNAGMPIPGVAEQLARPDLAEQLLQLEKAQRDSYRRSAHLLPAAARLSGDEAQRLRAEVERARDARESLAGRDLTGADLRGLDLSGLSFDEGFLENADLAGARLVGANLARVVLARADLTGADLTDAVLAGANLGNARLAGARLCRADLSGADLSSADLRNADFEGARLDKATLMGAVATGTRFAGVRARRLTVLDLDLSDADFSGAELPEAVFVRPRLLRTDFRGADLAGACFVAAQCSEARFDGAKAAGLRAVSKSDLSRASFDKANLTGANLRGVILAGCRFDEATLTSADLSEADAQGASLQCIRARGMLAMRTNLKGADLYGADLMHAVLQKADVAGADFSACNLFRADLARMKGDDHTRFDGANIQQARVVARERS